MAGRDRWWKGGRGDALHRPARPQFGGRVGRRTRRTCSRAPLPALATSNICATLNAGRYRTGKWQQVVRAGAPGVTVKRPGLMRRARAFFVFSGDHLLSWLSARLRTD